MRLSEHESDEHEGKQQRDLEADHQMPGMI